MPFIPLPGSAAEGETEQSGFIPLPGRARETPERRSGFIPLPQNQQVQPARTNAELQPPTRRSGFIPLPQNQQARPAGVTGPGSAPSPARPLSGGLAEPSVTPPATPPGTPPDAFRPAGPRVIRRPPPTVRLTDEALAGVEPPVVSDPPAPTHVQIEDDLLSGRPVDEQGMTLLLNAAARGGPAAFRDPDRVQAALDLLAPSAGQALRDMAARGMALTRARETTGSPTGNARLDAALEGLASGVTLGASERVAPVLGPDIQRELAAQQDVRQERAPWAHLGGEVVGSVLPYAGAINALRTARTARGWLPVRPGTAGVVREGAEVGAVLEALRRPPGAEQMDATEQVVARATQSAAGVAAGAVGDVLLTEVLAPLFRRAVAVPVERLTSRLRDRRLAQEARDAGHDSVESYVAAAVDVVTQNGETLVVPKQDLLRRPLGDTGQPDAAATTGAAPDAPTPEAQATLNAQIDAFREGRKRGVLFTPGEPLPQVLPEGAVLSEIGERGTLLHREADAEAALLARAGRMGQALDYGIDEKPPITSGQVVTARDAQGRVIQDVVTDGRADVQDAARRVAGPDGSVEVRSTAEALRERERGEKQPVRTRDALQQRIGTLNRRADELERLARATTDDFVRQDLLTQARIARQRAQTEDVTLTPFERAREQRAITDDDDLLTAIRKLGGIDTDTPEAQGLRGRFTHLPRPRPGLMAIERPGKGLSLDDLAEALKPLGYLRERDTRELEELLMEAQSGEPLFPHLRAENESRIEELAQAHLENQRGGEGSSDADWRYERLDPDDEIPGDFVIDTADGTVVPARPLDEDDLFRLIEEERNAEEFFRRESGDAAGDPSATDQGGVSERLENPLQGRHGGEPDTPQTGFIPLPARQQGELPGVAPRNETRQALSDRALALDARRGGDGRDVPVDAGPGELFTVRGRNLDIEDQIGRAADSRTPDVPPEAPPATAQAPDAPDRLTPGQRREYDRLWERSRLEPETMTAARWERLAELDDLANGTTLEAPRRRRATAAEDAELKADINEGLGGERHGRAAEIRDPGLSTGVSARAPVSGRGDVATGRQQPAAGGALRDNGDAQGAAGGGAPAAPGAGGGTRFFGRRARFEPVDELPTGLTRVASAADVAHLTAPLRRNAQETLLVVTTDADGTVRQVSRLGLGSKTGAQVDAALVAGAASRSGGERVWLVHNHPSGRAGQSFEDGDVLAQVDELLRGSGVTPEGIIAVAPGGTFSFTPVGGQSEAAAVNTIRPLLRSERVPVSERRLRGPATPDEVLDSDNALGEYFRTLPDESGVLLLDNYLRPLGWVPMTAEDLVTLRTGKGGGADRLFAAIDEANAVRIAARVTEPDMVRRVAGNLDGFARQSGIETVDVITPDYRSGLAEQGPVVQSTFYANPFLLGAGQALRDAARHPGRTATAAVAGGAGGMTFSDAEPGSAEWWLDVAAGAAAVTVGSGAARRLHLLGPGSIAEAGRLWVGKAIARWIPGMNLGPEALRQMQREQRALRQMIDRQTQIIGTQLLQRFTPTQRVEIADLIEGKAIVKDFNLIHRQAQVLDDYLTFAGERMKELGMLPEDLATGGYLHRYYAKHLGLDGAFRAAKGQTLSGSYTQARGTEDGFDDHLLSAGARALVDEVDGLTRQIDRLEGTLRGDADLATDATRAQVKALKQQRRALWQREIHEYVSKDGGERFFFLADETPVVPREPDSLATRPDGPGTTLVGPERLVARPGQSRQRAAATRQSELERTERVWSVRGRHKGQAYLHRDWTETERAGWGEIKDAGYRYVRGMAEASHDLSLAVLYKSIAERPEWASATPKTSGGKDWIEVPKTAVGKRSPLRKYGALSGMYVRPDVWQATRRYGRSVLGESAPARVYRGAVNRWKLYKTVYNPVTHLNNTYSNLEMLYMAGYGGRDLATGITHVQRGEGSELWSEARDHGLFGADWASTLVQSDGARVAVLDDLARQLREQPEIPDATLSLDLMMRAKEWWIESAEAVKGADTTLKTGAALARAAAKPVGGVLRKVVGTPVKAYTTSAKRLYQWEDNIFKMGVYAAERRKGKTPAQAVTEANRYFFDYNELPEAMRYVRDLPIGAPFITYTYKAVPAIVRNIIHNPERWLALVAGYEAINYAALTAEGLEPGEYWATQEAEESVAPPWDRGRALWGARNTIRLPGLDGYRLAMGRTHALGNPFMTEAGGREKLPAPPFVTNFWGSSLAGGNPLHALLDVYLNEDWRGKQIYKPGAPRDEKVRAALNYVYQAWTPSNILTPGSYHQQKVLAGMANQVRRAQENGELPPVIAPVVDLANGVAQALGYDMLTGLDRMGNEISTRDALLGSFGIKVRPVRHEDSVRFEQQDILDEMNEIDRWLMSQARDYHQNRISGDAMDSARDDARSRLRALQEQARALDEALGRMERQGIVTQVE